MQRSLLKFRSDTLNRLDIIGGLKGLWSSRLAVLCSPKTIRLCASCVSFRFICSFRTFWSFIYNELWHLEFVHFFHIFFLISFSYFFFYLSFLSYLYVYAFQFFFICFRFPVFLFVLDAMKFAYRPEVFNLCCDELARAFGMEKAWARQVAKRFGFSHLIPSTSLYKVILRSTIGASSRFLLAGQARLLWITAYRTV